MRRHEDFDPGKDDEGRERLEPKSEPRGGVETPGPRRHPGWCSS